MIARYHSKCAKTGAAIRPGDTIAFTRARRPILMQKMHNDGVSDVISFGDNTFYRNKNGRCEDAPCCGCCTI
jgi:hypothetical protein